MQRRDKLLMQDQRCARKKPDTVMMHSRYLVSTTLPMLNEVCSH